MHTECVVYGGNIYTKRAARMCECVLRTHKCIDDTNHSGLHIYRVVSYRRPFLAYVIALALTQTYGCRVHNNTHIHYAFELRNEPFFSCCTFGFGIFGSNFFAFIGNRFFFWGVQRRKYYSVQIAQSKNLCVS